MQEAKADLARLQEISDRCPFNRWLGIKIVSVGAGELQMVSDWREEMMSSPERRFTHGGVLAALVDTAAGYAVATLLGHASPTVDLRTDYHRAAVPGPLTMTAKVVRLGRSIGTADAWIHDSSGRLAASGRGTFLTSQSTARQPKAEQD